MDTRSVGSIQPCCASWRRRSVIVIMKVLICVFEFSSFLGLCNESLRGAWQGTSGVCVLSFSLNKVGQICTNLN